MLSLKLFRTNLCLYPTVPHLHCYYGSTKLCIYTGTCKVVHGYSNCREPYSLLYIGKRLVQVISRKSSVLWWKLESVLSQKMLVAIPSLLERLELELCWSCCPTRFHSDGSVFWGHAVVGHHCLEAYFQNLYLCGEAEIVLQHSRLWFPLRRHHTMCVWVEIISLSGFILESTYNAVVSYGKDCHME
jgi:hypothetical protein